MSFDLQTEVDRIYRMIERKVLFLSTDPFLPCPLTGNCRLLKTYADNIIKWAQEYDTKDLPPINGFHSWVRVIIKFGERVLNDVHDRGAYEAFSDPSLIRSSIILLSGLELVARLKIDLSIKNKELCQDSLISPYDCSTAEAISLQDQLIDDEIQTKTIFQFQLLSNLTSKMIIETKPRENCLNRILKSIATLWIYTFIDSLPTSTSKIKSLAAFFETINAPLIKSLPMAETTFTVMVPACGYAIDMLNLDLVECSEVQELNPVQILKSRTHSGKFVLFVRFENENFPSNIHHLSESHNIIIASFDCDSKFKPCFKQLLDTYLWLWSPNSISLFNTAPRHVTVVGHGLCGTLTLSLSCLLSNERAANSSPRLSTVHVPDRIISICSPYLLKICESPSRLLGFVNVPPKFCDRKNNWIASKLELLESYLDIRSRKKRRNLSYTTPKISYILTLFSSSFRYISSRFLPVSRFPSTIDDWNQLRDPWLRDVSTRITRLNHISSNGLISPILHPKISEHHSTSLHLMIDYFDINLDDNMRLAKLWRGPLKIHILNSECEETSSWFKPATKINDRKFDAVCKKLINILESGE